MDIPCVRTKYNWIQDFADIYHEYLIEKANPVVMEWPLISWDRLNVFIISCYVLFVNIIGPRWMKDRPPFDLRWLMVPYNICLVIVNFYIFKEYAKVRWIEGNAVNCHTLEITNDPTAYRLAEITWLFYLTKYVELSDTIFFVLRKKDRQLSRLHLVHHSSVPLIIWGMLRSEPGGYNSFFPLANSFVHCVMYTYYGIAALGDDVQFHLKFKKYITMTQMIQFILVLSYMISLPIYGCNVSRISYSANTCIAGFFFILFCNFYWHEYIENRKEAEKQATILNSKSVLNGKKKSK